MYVIFIDQVITWYYSTYQSVLLYIRQVSDDDNDDHDHRHNITIRIITEAWSTTDEWPIVTLTYLSSVVSIYLSLTEGMRLSDGEIQKLLKKEREEAEEMIEKYSKKQKETNVSGLFAQCVTKTNASSVINDNSVIIWQCE